MATYYKYEKY
jgi:hypothetical protein